MDNGVWWASRDTDRSIVEIRDHKPSMICAGGGKYALGSGVGVFVMFTVCEFEALSGTTVQPGEIIPIRPLRIERSEVLNAD